MTNWKLGPGTAKSSIDDILCNLVAEQKKELQRGVFASRRRTTEGSLESWLMRSGRFQEVYGEAVAYNLISHTDDEFHSFERELAGRLFQDLAYSVLAGRNYPSAIVLSPEKTLEFYRALYPSRRLNKENFGLDSLLGITVPDGLIVQEQGGFMHIAAVCEYTLMRDYYYFSSKYDGFESHSEKNKRLLGGSCLRFVVPNDEPFPAIARYTGVEFMGMPFNRWQFGKFMEYLISEHRMDEGMPTLAEIRAEVRFQHERVMENLTQRNLTPEQADYLMRLGTSHTALINGPGFSKATIPKT